MTAKQVVDILREEIQPLPKTGKPEAKPDHLSPRAQCVVARVSTTCNMCGQAIETDTDMWWVPAGAFPSKVKPGLYHYPKCPEGSEAPNTVRRTL